MQNKLYSAKRRTENPLPFTGYSSKRVHLKGQTCGKKYCYMNVLHDISFFVLIFIWIFPFNWKLCLVSFITLFRDFFCFCFQFSQHKKKENQTKREPGKLLNLLSFPVKMHHEKYIPKTLLLNYMFICWAELCFSSYGSFLHSAFHNRKLFYYLHLRKSHFPSIVLFKILLYWKLIHNFFNTEFSMVRIIRFSSSKMH